MSGWRSIRAMLWAGASIATSTALMAQPAAAAAPASASKRVYTSADFTKPQYDNLTVSYSNKTGPLDYTVSAAALSGRGGLGGPVTITDASHHLIETRDEVYHSEYHEFVFKTKLSLDGPGSSLGNLSLTYNPYWSPQFLGDTRLLATGERRSRTNRQTKPGYNADINGDYEFALGPGRLKRIGRSHRKHARNTTTQIRPF